jgi:hypothetical protein
MAKDLKEFASHEFLEAYPDYKMVRDCFKGERCIKDAGMAYLPQLKAQSQEDYANYLFRALFFPITGKSCTTMVGLATVKPPKTTYPSEMEAMFKDDALDYQFTETYVSILTEITLQGRHGVLIDAPEQGGDPKFCCYIAENIVRWDVDYDGKLMRLLLREYVNAPVDGDEYKMSRQVRYRKCWIDLDGLYTVQVLDDDLKEAGPAIKPSFSGQRIDYIPFVCFGSTGVHMEVDRPPMLDIATINVSHYLTSADLEWGRHIVGLPTPVVSGVDAATKLSIGGTAAWILPNEAAKAYYLEFQGLGLKSLETAMSDKISLMASVSARMVDTSTRGSEAAETVRLRYMSESASIVHIISAVENGLVMLYNMMARLRKANGPVTIQLSREILGAGISFKDLATLFDGYFKGAVTKETLLYNMRRLDAVDPNRTDEDELRGIKDPPPPQPRATQNTGVTP